MVLYNNVIIHQEKTVHIHVVVKQYVYGIIPEV